MYAMTLFGYRISFSRPRFYLPKFVLPRNFWDRGCVAYFSRGEKNEMRIHLQLRARRKCTVVLWKFRGSETGAGEGSGEEKIRKGRSNRTRYEEIETFLEPRLLRGASSPALHAAWRTCPQTRVMHRSPQRHFCGSSRETLACLIQAKWNIYPTIITMTLHRAERIGHESFIY